MKTKYRIRLTKSVQHDFQVLHDRSPGDLDAVVKLLDLLALEEDPTQPLNTKDLNVRPITRDVRYGHLWRCKPGRNSSIKANVRIVFQVLKEGRDSYLEVTAWRRDDGLIGNILRILMVSHRADAYGPELARRYKDDGVHSKVRR